MKGGKKEKRQNTGPRLQTCTDTGVLHPPVPLHSPPTPSHPRWVLFATELMRLRTRRLLSCCVYFLSLSISHSLFLSLFLAKRFKGKTSVCAPRTCYLQTRLLFINGGTRSLVRKRPFATPGAPPLKFRFSPLGPASCSRRRSRSSLKVVPCGLSLLPRPPPSQS